MEDFNSYLKSKITDPEEMMSFGHSFNEMIKLSLRDRLLSQKRTCFENHNKIAEDYAKCMYALKKGMMDESRKFKFMGQFIKFKINSCLETKTVDDRDKCFMECQNQAQKIWQIIGNL